MGRRRRRHARKLEIKTQTYYRWWKEYGGLKVERAKRLVAELPLEKQILKDAAEGNF